MEGKLAIPFVSWGRPSLTHLISCKIHNVFTDIYRKTNTDIKHIQLHLSWWFQGPAVKLLKAKRFHTRNFGFVDSGRPSKPLLYQAETSPTVSHLGGWEDRWMHVWLTFAPLNRHVQHGILKMKICIRNNWCIVLQCLNDLSCHLHFNTWWIMVAYSCSPSRLLFAGASTDPFFAVFCGHLDRAQPQDNSNTSLHIAECFGCLWFTSGAVRKPGRSWHEPDRELVDVFLMSYIFFTVYVRELLAVNIAWSKTAIFDGDAARYSLPWQTSPTATDIICLFACK